MTKRRITAHKGGRTARAPEARMTQDDRYNLAALLAERGMSFGDWIVEKLHHELTHPALSNIHAAPRRRAVAGRQKGQDSMIDESVMTIDEFMASYSDGRESYMRVRLERMINAAIAAEREANLHAITNAANDFGERGAANVEYYRGYKAAIVNALAAIRVRNGNAAVKHGKCHNCGGSFRMTDSINLSMGECATCGADWPM